MVDPSKSTFGATTNSDSINPDPTILDEADDIVKSEKSALNMSGVLLAFVTSLVIVAVMGMILGQKIGYSRGVSHSIEDRLTGNGEEASTQNIKALKLKVDTLQNQVNTAQQERDISLANLEKLRDDMNKLHITNLQLQQSRAFLTESLASKGGMTLQIIGAKIAPLPENAYEYRFDVGMVDSGNQERLLTPKLTLLDDVNMVEVPLEPKNYGINGVVLIRGRFVMPKDFKPKQAKLELSVAGQTIEQIYDWQYGQPVADLPYSLEELSELDKRPIAAIEAEQQAKQQTKQQ
ncbi:hypothetical protein MOMA_08396 [Moraxella macacae 0408225]|uniref:Uncharacterized protein n=1 Tax=Moraxella macacae 0408225 TaxID=1230338 RepID=L2F6B9_9GAMM|nr:hypothetical protein [Moraxella macacae]ELA08567.1 hypothetical protein MOMA_08396 [Moraxella macacae 0408225]